MGSINDDKLLVYKFIYQCIVQVFLIGFAVYIFMVIFNKFVVSNNPLDATKFGVSDTILGYTLYRIYRHFFPIRDGEEKATASSSQSTPTASGSTTP
jgi:hypothetical protein